LSDDTMFLYKKTCILAMYIEIMVRKIKNRVISQKNTCCHDNNYSYERNV